MYEVGWPIRIIPSKVGVLDGYITMFLGWKKNSRCAPTVGLKNPKIEFRTWMFQMGTLEKKITH